MTEVHFQIGNLNIFIYEVGFCKKMYRILLSESKFLLIEASWWDSFG